MRIEALRKLAGREEIDYQFLISALQSYLQPRDKVSQWLKSGDLIRIKKVSIFLEKLSHKHPILLMCLRILFIGHPLFLCSPMRLHSYYRQNFRVC